MSDYVKAALEEYRACEECYGEGCVYNDNGGHRVSRNDPSATGRRICCSCQGQRLFGGWSNEYFADLRAGKVRGIGHAVAHPTWQAQPAQTGGE